MNFLRKTIKSRSAVSIVASSVLSVFLVAAATQAATVIGTAIVTAGNITTSNGNILATAGNITAGGTLNATGATVLSSTLAVTGDFAVNADKFTVTAASGNTAVAGTFGVTGKTSLGKATSTMMTANKLYIGTADTGSAIAWQGSGSNIVNFSGFVVGEVGCIVSSQTITVTGAVAGDTIMLGIPNNYASSTKYMFNGWVSSGDTVSVKACNTATTTTPYALSNGTIKASVWH
ncbi:hypothetical protein D4R99_00950 [bacterium]|nr:MAG: hypothetical protein D4R99_00950 [bacterium]